MNIFYKQKFRNCFSAVVLFKNATDVRSNTYIANMLGCRPGYNAAMKLFEQRGIFCYGYVVCRADVFDEYSVKCATNLYGEIPKLGPNQWVFDLPK